MNISKEDAAIIKERMWKNYHHSDLLPSAASAIQLCCDAIDHYVPITIDPAKTLEEASEHN